MKARWDLILLPSLVVMLLLLGASQYVFLKGSFFRDLGLGRTGDVLEATNYLRFFTDPFYLRVLWITTKVSLLATVFTLLLGYPLAYVIARMRSRWAMVLLAGVVVTTFVTIVIKVFGLIIIFSAEGSVEPIPAGPGRRGHAPTPSWAPTPGSWSGSCTSRWDSACCCSTASSAPSRNRWRMPPRSMVRAGLRVFLRVIFPLSLPGVTVGALMVFNMCMGAFTSAALLGAGKVFTLPVLIQRTVMMEVKYSMAATQAAVLLVSVLLINLLSIYLLRRLRTARLVVA